MPSDFGRGLKFGIGFVLGIGLILALFLFGISMCAGQFHRRMMEQMKEQIEEMRPQERRPEPETRDDRVAAQSQGKLLFPPGISSAPG